MSSDVFLPLKKMLINSYKVLFRVDFSNTNGPKVKVCQGKLEKCTNHLHKVTNCLHLSQQKKFVSCYFEV